MDKKSSINKIQEKQEDCKCGRGDQVRYYCKQQGCDTHRNNLFFCSDCLDEIQDKVEQGEPHAFKQIHYFIKEVTTNWVALIEKEGSIHTRVSTMYNSNKSLIEFLEAQAMRQAGVVGARLIRRDKEKFDQFHAAFKEKTANYEEYSAEFSVAKLHLLNASYAELNNQLEQEFKYLLDIASPDFIFDNYRSCILDCPIPMRQDEKQLREKILEMKVKLGKMNVSAASNMTKVIYGQQELVEAVNNLKHEVGKQEAQLNAFTSLFGGLEGASEIVKICFNNQIHEGENKLRELQNRINDQTQAIQNDLQLRDKQFKDFKTSIEVQIRTNQEESRISQIQNLQKQSKDFENEIKKLQAQLKVEQNKQDAQLKDLKSGIQGEIKSLEDQSKKESQKQAHSYSSIQAQLQKVEDSFKKDLRLQIEKHEQLSAQMITSTAKIQQLLQVSSKIEEQQKAITILQKSRPTIFTQSKLERLIAIFNQPINGYTPILNSQSQSKLAEFILKSGWKWSLAQLNAKTDMSRVVEWTTFEGAKRGNGFGDLQQGIYYGQMLDGKRDGYGVVFCTATNNEAWLYECEWKQGTPVNNGRFIWIYTDNNWRKYEGPLMSDYLITGTGSWQHKDGDSYQGELKQGNRHGQGKYNWPDGRSYQGEWKDGQRTGQGRFTNADGTYNEGEFTVNKQVGVHKYYTKEGVFTKEQDHK
ncbi:hypothetical protein FGO68_gene1905 [Halteria grandinella]|uniref:MORN repeat protein n=1 Tax=Halteria grandinella TaxID=5974 RepID=A0A8J8NXN2_HALGN|nr:hypothetical protein FGO68_gene1905 [Halteria grandinella]